MFGNFIRKIVIAGLTVVTGFLMFATNPALAACSDCQKINGELVRLKEVGVVAGDYDYAITTAPNSRKFKITGAAVGKAEKALILGLKVFVNTNTNNFSLTNDR